MISKTEKRFPGRDVTIKDEETDSRRRTSSRDKALIVGM